MLDFLRNHYELGYEFNEDAIKKWAEEEKIRPEDLANTVFKKFEDGEKICVQGHKVDKVYLLLSGAVRVMSYLGDKKRVELTTLYAPMFLGDMEVLAGEKVYAASVEVESAASCIIYTPEEFERVLENNKAFTLATAKRISKHLALMSRKNGADLQYTNHGLILRFFIDILKENQDIPEITLSNLPRTKMSEKTGIAERTLNRVIADFIQRGWIKIIRGKVCLIQKHRKEMEAILPTMVKD